MAYTLNRSGYYKDSKGNTYDAASGWSASKDGKTLTNSYTGQTVRDTGAGSTGTTAKTTSATGSSGSTKTTTASKSTGSSSSKSGSSSGSKGEVRNTSNIQSISGNPMTGNISISTKSSTGSSKSSGSSTVQNATAALNTVSSSAAPNVTWTPAANSYNVDRTGQAKNTGSAANVGMSLQAENTGGAAAQPQGTVRSSPTVTDQASALAAMMQNSEDWTASKGNAAVQKLLSQENRSLAEKWFPGATIDNTGVWYYNGKPLYSQTFGGSAAPVTGAAKEAEPNIIWNPTPNHPDTDGAVTETAVQNPYITNSAETYGIIQQMKQNSQAWTNADQETRKKLAAQNKELAQRIPGAYIDNHGVWWIGDQKLYDAVYQSPLAEVPQFEYKPIEQTQYAPGAFEYTPFEETPYAAESFSFTPFEQTEQGRQLLNDYQDLLSKVENYDAFTYDPNTDPAYLQYADSYTRGGQRAMTNVLGQLAARTGGMASSYAGAMAQQTYDQYMADLANKVPELRQLAYSMYVDDYNRQVDQYNRGYQQYADAYGRYMDDTRFRYGQYQDETRQKYDQYMDDLRFRYGQYQDDTQQKYNQYLNDLNFRYGQYQDQLADAWKQTEWQNQMDQQALDNYRNSLSWNAAQEEAAYSRQKEQEALDYQKEQADREWAWREQERADQQALLESQKQEDAVAQLWDQVNRYGRIPSMQAVLSAGLTENDYWEMAAQAQRIRASDASRYYSGW